MLGCRNKQAASTWNNGGHDIKFGQKLGKGGVLQAESRYVLKPHCGLVKSCQFVLVEGLALACGLSLLLQGISYKMRHLSCPVPLNAAVQTFRSMSAVHAISAAACI